MGLRGVDVGLVMFGWTCGSFSGFFLWWGNITGNGYGGILACCGLGMCVYVHVAAQLQKNNFGWAQVFYDCWISLYVIFWSTKYFAQ